MNTLRPGQEHKGRDHQELGSCYSQTSAYRELNILDTNTEGDVMSYQLPLFRRKETCQSLRGSKVCP